MHLLVGLGNPGSEYAGSRHNLGFRVIEALSRRLAAEEPVQKHWSLIAAAAYRGRELILVQPLTYMNRSGIAVVELARSFKVELSDLLVIHDDLDLPPGKLRLSRKGGSAGHRGIESIIEKVGSEEFSRLRIGIGKPTLQVESADYVLEPIEGKEAEVYSEAVGEAVDAILLVITEGLEAAMNVVNRGIASSS